MFSQRLGRCLIMVFSVTKIEHLFVDQNIFEIVINQSMNYVKISASVSTGSFL